MFLPPELKKISQSRKVTKTFGGLNLRSVTGDAEFADISNMTADAYPALRTRDRRSLIQENGKSDYFTAEKLGRITLLPPYQLRYDNTVTSLSYRPAVSAGAVASIGAYLYFAEGNYVLNTEDEAPYLKQAAYTYTLSGYTNSEGLLDYSNPSVVKLSAAYTDGAEIGGFSAGKEFPESPGDGDLFFNNGEDRYYRYYADNSGVWRICTKLRYTLTSSNIAASLNVNDYVKLSGIARTNYGTAQRLPVLNGYYAITGVTANSVSVEDEISSPALILSPHEGTYGPIDKSAVIPENIPPNSLPLPEGSITRAVPEMEYICSSNNRIWGCSSEKHEIYACELGNPYNWYRYEGLSSDSYAVTIGSPGDFTGAVNYLGTPLFFKEGEMIKITGSRPSSFGVSSYTCKGVAKTCGRSAVICNDALYYKGIDGFYRYSGGTPQKISDSLGDKYNLCNDNVACGVLGNKVYAFCAGDILVYDTKTAIWHKETVTSDSTAYMLALDNRLLLIEQDKSEEKTARSRVWSVDGQTVDGISEGLETPVSEDTLTWYAETGDREACPSGRNYITRLDMNMSVMGSCEVSVQYDGSGEWTLIKTIETARRGDRMIRFLPRRCEYYRLRFSGRGECTIFSITETVEEAKEYV